MPRYARKPKRKFETQTATLHGVEREFTIYPQSIFITTDYLTKKKIPRGSQVAAFKLDGKNQYVRWPLPDDAAEEAKDPMSGFEPDEYKIAWAQAMRDTSNHIMVDAKAGSGKTRGLCYALRQMDEVSDTACFAFGVDASVQMKLLMPSWVEVSTLHAEALKACLAHYGKTRVKKDKLWDIINEFIPADGPDRRICRSVADAVGKCKADAIHPGDLEGIKSTVEYYGVECSPAWLDTLVDYVNDVLVASTDLDTWGIEFDDMGWLIAIDDIPLPHYNLIGIDEAQDLCKNQHMMVEKWIKGGARIVAVGDPHQSLYWFRGAVSDSFYQLQDMLATSDKGVKTLDLPINYRSATSILKLAGTKVSGIQPRPGAPEGTITESTTIEELIERLDSEKDAYQGGDAILCRVNLPLIDLAYKFHAQGIPFTMNNPKEGYRMIGKVKFLADENSDLNALLDRLSNWEEEICATIRSAIKQEQIREQGEAIRLMAAHAYDVDSLIAEIQRLFCDGDTKGVTLSTIHASKGLQWKRVWCIRNDLLPHPMAETEEEKAQEDNAWFVMVTRAEDELHFIPHEGEEKKAA